MFDYFYLFLFTLDTYMQLMYLSISHKYLFNQIFIIINKLQRERPWHTGVEKFFPFLYRMLVMVFFLFQRVFMLALHD